MLLCCIAALLACLLACWLAGWLAGWLACWLAGWSPQRHSEQLAAQLKAEQDAHEEHLRKLKAMKGNVEIDVDFNFTDEDRDAALAKLCDAATKVRMSLPQVIVDYYSVNGSGYCLFEVTFC